MARAGHRRATLILVLLLAAAGALPALPAAEEGLRVELGFGGYVVPERWAPLRIQAGVEAPGGRIELLRLAADGSGTFPEYYPYLPGIPLECPVMADAAAAQLRVRLLSGGLILAEAKLDTRRRSFPGHLVLLVGLPAGARGGAAAALEPLEPIVAINLPLDRLPAEALDYDAVAALALRDPGRALSPAQGQALGAWLAGGGRLLLFEARPAKDSLLATLQPLSLEARGDGAKDAGTARAAPRELRLGCGTILVRADRAPEADGAAWKELLGLPPYEKSARLGPGRAFTALDEPRAFPLEPFAVDSRLALAIGAWALFVLALGLSRRRAALPLLALSLAAGAAAWLGGAVLRPDLPSPLAADTRLLVLPGGRAAFAQFGLRPRPLASFEALEAAQPAFDATLRLGAESGRFNTEGGGSYSHPSRRPFAVLRPNLRLAKADGGIVLEASLPGSILEGSSLPAVIEALAEFEAAAGPASPGEALSRALAEAAKAVGAAGGARLAWVSASPETSWREWRAEDGSWARREGFPPWLAADAPWVLRLCAATRAAGFLVGFEAFPALEFAPGGATRSEAAWVLPLGLGQASSQEATR